MSTKQQPIWEPSRGSTPQARVGSLLVVEPQSLLRWSLATYLSKWFDVFPTDCREVANRILQDHPIDAVVVSDELPVDTVEEVEGLARARNPSTRLVRTVTTLTCGPLECAGTCCIEKPFELSNLANLLGVDVECSSRAT